VSQLQPILPETVDELCTLVIVLFQKQERFNTLVAALQQQNTTFQTLYSIDQNHFLNLKQRLNLDHTNSSKSPSSQLPFLKSKPIKLPKGYSRGAQSGHKGHHRSLLLDDHVHNQITLPMLSCLQCFRAFYRNENE
jgi:hypothetical protein